VPLGSSRPTRAFAKNDVVKFTPRQPREETDYSGLKKEMAKPLNPFASRDGAVPASLPEYTPPPAYVSTRSGVSSSSVPSRKIVSPKASSYEESEAEPESEPQPTPKNRKKQNIDDDEPTPIGRVQAVPSVVDENRPKVKEDPTKLFQDDDDLEEKEAKRGTPAAARKQKDALLDSKEKLKSRLKDDPPAKGGKKHYTVDINADGSAKTAQDLLEQRQKEAAQKERRAKEKQDKELRADRRQKLKAQKEAESQRKAQLTGSGAKYVKKKQDDDDPESEEEPLED